MVSSMTYRLAKPVVRPAGIVPVATVTRLEGEKDTLGSPTPVPGSVIVNVTKAPPIGAACSSVTLTVVAGAGSNAESLSLIDGLPKLTVAFTGVAPRLRSFAPTKSTRLLVGV